MVRRQQLDAACDSPRTHCPSSPSCCDVPSSPASLVIRDFGHRCRSGLNTCNTVLSAPISSATALTRHCSGRFSTSLRSAQTIPRPNVLDSKVLVSRPRPPVISGRSETKLWWERRSRFALARRSPESSLLLALSSRVEAFWSSLGNGRRTQQRPRTASQNRRSWIEETRHPQRSARAYHALRPHCTQAFTQECSYSHGVYNRGEGNATTTPLDVYYILR